MFARLPNSGTERVLEGERYLFGREGTPVPVRVVLRRIGSREAESPFLVLATWTVDPGEATRLYQRRWEIESMFAALKSRGFDLEATDLTDPRRVERPVGLLALAFSWTRLVGDRRAQKDAPNGQGLLQSKHTGAESGACSFCGLDRLQSILTTPEPQPQAFFKCLRVLRSPTAFLSCT